MALLPNGNIAVAGGGAVAEYDPAGNIVSTFGGLLTTGLSDIRALAPLANGDVLISGFDTVYDDKGERVAETVGGGGGVTTLYLTDTQNPTGYDHPLEARNSATGQLVMTYLLGDRVLGQADATGTVTCLLADGHGSTRVLVTAVGTVVAAFNYDAFGTALNFNPAMAATAFLFGGDAFYDAPSGLFFHGDGVRTRMGFIFLQRDFGRRGQGNRQDPLSLHKYLYADANPVNGNDPTGHMFGLLDTLGSAAEGAALDTMGAVGGNAAEMLTEDVVAEAEAQSFEEVVVEDEELGFNFDSRACYELSAIKRPARASMRPAKATK